MKHIFTLLLVLSLTGVVSAQGDSAASMASRFEELVPKLDCKNLVDEAQVSAQEAAHLEMQAMALAASADAQTRAEFNKLAVAALAKEQPALTQMWLLRQLRWTGTTAEIPTVAACLTKNVTFVVDEAALTLAAIGGPDAKAALEAAQTNATGRQKEILRSALTNLSQKPGILEARSIQETKLPLAIPYIEKAEVDNWLKGWDALDENTKVQTLAALSARGDKSYVQYAAKAMESDSEPLKRSGLLAMEKLATPAQLPLILNYSDSGLASRIASFVVADGFDATLLAALKDAQTSERFKLVSGILASRSVDVSDTLFARAKQKECADRLELMRQAQKIAGKDRVGDFVDILVLCPAGRDRDDAERIVAAVTPGDASAVIAKMGQYPGTALFGCLGRIGGDAARDTLHKAADQTDESVRDAAVKALCNWPNAQDADNLFALSQNSQYNNGQRVAALRAYIRVVSLPNDQIGIRASDADKMAMLKKAFDAAWRLDEKKLVLSRLSAVRCDQALDFAIASLEDSQLYNDACRAFADLIHHNDFRKARLEKVKPVMDKIIETSKDAGMVDRVRRYRDQP